MLRKLVIDSVEKYIRQHYRHTFLRGLGYAPRFSRSELYGKLANICGDLDARNIRHSGGFKMLTGEDMIHADRKYRGAIEFQSYALPIFAANEPPFSSDHSEAWFGRWLILPMINRIPTSRQDPHLTKRLTAEGELQGLLVKAIRALRRLMKRGRFEQPKSIRRASRRYRERADTVRGFVKETCDLAAGRWIERPRLYQRYKFWCEDSGRRPLGKQTFYD